MAALPLTLAFPLALMLLMLVMERVEHQLSDPDPDLRVEG